MSTKPCLDKAAAEHEPLQRCVMASAQCGGKVMKLRRRTITDADHPFLATLYASTRQEELAPVPWTDEQKQAFLQFQFEAQHTHYMQHFPDASYEIILLKNKPIGRLYLDRREDEIRIVDIALLQAYRNRGIGSQLLHTVFDEARAAGLLVRIHVEVNNPAMRLYQRLGFRKVNEDGIYWLMEWTPSDKPTKES